MSCPTNETLERLALGFLDDERDVRKHTDACAECAKTLSHMRTGHEALTAAAKRVKLPSLAPRRPLSRPHVWAIAAGLLVVVGLVFVTPHHSPEPPAPPGIAPGTVAAVEKDGLAAAKGELRGPAREVNLLNSVDGDPVGATLPATGLASRNRGLYDSTGVTLGGKRPMPEPKPAPPDKPFTGLPGDMTFKNPGVNPTTDTAKEATSTFALDVDTASYTLARKYLREGNVPPADAIRVEEFVNYFRYHDEAPPVGTFAIRLEAAPSPYDESMHLLRVGIRAKDLKAKERKDVVLTLLIDVSGSMASGGRLELVKKSVRFLLEKLRPTDKIAVCTFTTYARKLLDATPVSEKEKILAAVDPLTPQNSTNVKEGLEVAYKAASDAFDAKLTNRVMLFSDGVANTGDTVPESMLDAISRDAARGIFLTVMGVGMGNFNDKILETLANKGNGNYAYIDTFDEAKKAFGERLLGTLDIVAIDAKLQAEFDPATVATFRLVGYENRHVANQDFRNDKVDAGEVGPGHQVTALYEIRLKPDTKGRLVTVRIRFKEPGTNEMIEDQQSISAAQVLPKLKDASPSFRLASAVMQFAEVLRGSPRAKEVSLERVADEAKFAAREMDRQADADEFLELVKIARDLKLGRRD